MQRDLTRASVDAQRDPAERTHGAAPMPVEQTSGIPHGWRLGMNDGLDAPIARGLARGSRLLLAVLGGALCLAGLTACGPATNTLGGSLGELFPLEISQVEAVRNEEALQLTYLRNHGRDLDIVLRLTVALGPEEALAQGLKLSLVGRSPQGYRRATLVHIPGGEPARELGEVSAGQLVIRKGGEPGARLEGDFSARFPEGTGLAAGRNIFGDFTVELQDARTD